MGSAGAPGARAPRRQGCGRRVCKGAGAPDEGPSVGCGTSGKGAAWGRAGAQQRGAAQGRSVGLRRGCAGAQRGALRGRSRVGRRKGAVVWGRARARRGAA